MDAPVEVGEREEVGRGVVVDSELVVGGFSLVGGDCEGIRWSLPPKLRGPSQKPAHIHI